MKSYEFFLSVLEVDVPMETASTTELSLLEKVAKAIEEVGRELTVSE